MKKCPYCGEQIEDTVSKCPFCESDIEPQNYLDHDDNEKGLVTSEENAPEQQNLGPSNKVHKPLSNGFKVFITLISTIPLIGQLIAIIMAIIYMSSEGDPDKKSFGKALLIGTMVVFLLFCICCVAYMAFGMYTLNQMGPEFFEQFQQQY